MWRVYMTKARCMAGLTPQQIVITLVLLLGITFTFISTVTADSFPPLPEALAALESDEDVTVSEVTVPEWPAGSNFYYTFEPTLPDTTIGFIMYPGALVDPVSYAPFAHEIARGGFFTVIVKMINDIAIGESSQRATRIISDYPEIEKWAIGGHSMGGFAACAYTQENTENIDGVILWAAYPTEVARLDDKIIKVISIYGTNDGLATPEEIDDSRADLPPYTEFVAVVGGNHTQFGWYDTSPDPVQPNDNPADISRQQQQDIIVQETLDFLGYFNLCPTDPDNDYDNDTVCGDVDNCPLTANLQQEDNFPPNGNNCGDSCECEGNFDDDEDQDGFDAATFKLDFGRSTFFRPCANGDSCNGDFNCDVDVDGTDAAKFKEDFGRSPFSNPCPHCPTNPWCVYP
jgi:hypothetical protein